MRKRISYPALLVGGMLLLAVSFVPVAAFALEGSSNPGSPATGSQDGTKSTSITPTETKKTVSQTQPVTTPNTEHHLNTDKLRVCKAREKTIGSVMSRIGDRGQKQLDLYTGIADRVEAFYAKKGKTLSTYSTLVADVNAKKTTDQTAVNLVKSDKAGFKCDGTDPKSVATTFRTDQKNEEAALKAYKASIKSLIQGVKSVQTETSTTGVKQ